MDVDEEEQVVSSKKRRLSKAAQAKLKAQEKKKRRQKDNEDEDDDEDAYTALSKSLYVGNRQRPPIGNFENCATCEKQFTVVSLTVLLV